MPQNVIPNARDQVDSTTAVVNIIFLVVFVLGLGAAFLRIAVRMLAFVRSNRPTPSLLKRDFVLMGGLCFPFFLIFIARAFNLGSTLSGELWWTLLTGIPAIAGLYYFLYYEFFVIEDDV